MFLPAVLKAISEDSDSVPSLMSEYLQSEGMMKPPGPSIPSYCHCKNKTILPLQLLTA